MTTLLRQPPDMPQPYRITREMYYQMAELGFFEGHRVELIDGEIIEMAAMKDRHAIALGNVARFLDKAFPECWVRHQLPLSIAANSDPEPDISVVPGEPDDYREKGHPKSALLVVEIADTSLRYDRHQKASLYASAGIKEYWIINLVDDCVEILREPITDSSAPHGFRYGSTTTLRPPSEIASLEKPKAWSPVAKFLP